MPRRIIFPAAMLAASLALLAGPGSAQTVAPVPAVPPPTNTGRTLTDAPVPNAPAEQVAPADRAGSRSSLDAGPPNSTPFSGLPGNQSGGGASGSADRDRSGGGPPSLSR